MMEPPVLCQQKIRSEHCVDVRGAECFSLLIIRVWELPAGLRSTFVAAARNIYTIWGINWRV